MRHPKIPEHEPLFKKSYEYRRAIDRKPNGDLVYEWVFSVWGSSDQPLDLRFTLAEFNHRNPWLRILGMVAQTAWANVGDADMAKAWREWTEALPR